MSLYKNQGVFRLVVATALVAPVDRAIAAEPVPPAVIAVTTCGDSGPGSLREALHTAPDLATIDLGALPCADHTIRLSSGEIAFANAGALSIRGLPIVFARTMDAPLAAVTIDAGGSSRVFSQSGTGLLRIVGVALQNGRSELPGGCLASAGDVRIEETVVSGCTVEATTFGNGMGGGLYVAGSLTVVASRIVGNTATGDSAVEGGGLFSNGALDVAYSTIAGNSAVASSVFGNGGGLSASGDVLIDHSTISDNHATDIGGAYLLGADGVATLRIVDSTISGNVGGHVGALMALQSPVTIASSTIAFNSASGTDGIGGLAVANSPTLESTIVAGNAAPNGTADIAANCLGGGDCGLHVIGHANFVGTANLPLPADTLSGDPLLLPLADRGGPTATHALQRQSGDRCRQRDRRRSRTTRFGPARSGVRSRDRRLRRHRRLRERCGTGLDLRGRIRLHSCPCADGAASRMLTQDQASPAAR